MRIGRLLLVVFFGIMSSYGSAQNTDSLVNKLDSLKKQSDSLGHQVNQVEPGFYNEQTKITPKVFFILLADDFKQQTLSPLDLNRKSVVKASIIIGATIGLSFLDKPIQRWAVGFRNDYPGSRRYSNTITNIGGVYEVIPLTAIAATGFIFNNTKLRTTTALAVQSYITSSVWATIFKKLSGRIRPNNFDPNSPLNRSTFHGPFYKIPNGDNSAFPSGHAALAFAAATVYAKEYKNIKSIPFISYGVAGLITVSRITENRHWLSDLIAGSLLGYACGTQVVNNYHRFARLQRKKASGTKKIVATDVQLNLDYSAASGVQTGVTITF